MRKRTIIAAIVGLVWLTGCTHLHEGTVTEKEYQPERYYTTTVMQMVGKVMIPITYHHYDDADFILHVEGYDEDGEWTHDHVYVTEECFNAHSEGDYWHETPDCEWKDTGNTRERE